MMSVAEGKVFFSGKRAIESGKAPPEKDIILITPEPNVESANSREKELTTSPRRDTETTTPI